MVVSLEIGEFEDDSLIKDGKVKLKGYTKDVYSKYPVTGLQKEGNDVLFFYRGMLYTIINDPIKGLYMTNICERGWFDNFVDENLYPMIVLETIVAYSIPYSNSTISYLESPFNYITKEIDRLNGYNIDVSVSTIFGDRGDRGMIALHGNGRTYREACLSYLDKLMREDRITTEDKSNVLSLRIKEAITVSKVLEVSYV